ncbi:MAG: ATP-binding protein, partial [Firmicutes bacterium]|nr:ATP-binding protein [Candidatus Scatoplasma merdavium]
MDLYESNKIEFKVKFTDQIVKELVAFLNTDGGQIFVGINDHGEVVGASEIDKTLRNISDVISSQIEPSPLELISCEIKTMEGLPVIVINIKRGSAPIYCIKKYGFSSLGCPIRVGSTCREMTQEQINNRYKMRFFNDDLLVSSPTNLRELSFLTLKNYYSDMGYKLNDNTFETNLKLINDKGQYNMMAELLSDDSRFSFIFVKFEGKNKASLSQRSNYGNKSILFAYEQMMNRLQAENICISDTTIRPR